MSFDFLFTATSAICSAFRSVANFMPDFIKDTVSSFISSVALDQVAVPQICINDPENCCVDKINQLQKSADIVTKLDQDMATKSLVLFICGAFGGLAPDSDTYETMLSGLFPKYYSEHCSHQDVMFATWNSSIINDIIKIWHNAGQKIGIVAHSWGGDVAMSVAEQLNEENIKIDLLCTIDPVSFRGADGDIAKPSNVEQWINVAVDYEENNFKSFTNIPAILGGYWGDCQEADISMVVQYVENNGEIKDASHSTTKDIFYNYLDDFVSKL